MDFAKSLKAIRQEKKMSLQELANLSGVSKSMLSKVERREKNPTLQVAANIAEALGVTLSAMIAETQDKPVILIKKEERIIYHDEMTGFQRQLLSPTFSNPGIEFIFIIIPPGQQSPAFPPHRKGVKEYVILVKGKLRLLLNQDEYLLDTGDSIYFEADVTHQFLNTGQEECNCYLVIDSNALNPRSSQ